LLNGVDEAKAPRESTAGQKEEDKRRRSLLSPFTDEPNRVKMLSEDDIAKQLADKAADRKEKYLTGTVKKKRLDPVFFTASMTLSEALWLHNVAPSNDNLVYSGLPMKLWPPDYLTVKNTPLISRPQEEFLIAKETRLALAKTVAGLSPDEVLVLDSSLSSENAAQLGAKTGDEGKHKRTQERNGMERLRQVAGKLTAIVAANDNQNLSKIAA
jgi:hypothetical protein